MQNEEKVHRLNLSPRQHRLLAAAVSLLTITARPIANLNEQRELDVLSQLIRSSDLEEPNVSLFTADELSAIAGAMGGFMGFVDNDLAKRDFVGGRSTGQMYDLAKRLQRLRHTGS